MTFLTTLHLKLLAVRSVESVGIRFMERYSIIKQWHRGQLTRPTISTPSCPRRRKINTTHNASYQRLQHHWTGNTRSFVARKKESLCNSYSSKVRRGLMNLTSLTSLTHSGSILRLNILFVFFKFPPFLIDCSPIYQFVHCIVYCCLFIMCPFGLMTTRLNKH